MNKWLIAAIGIFVFVGLVLWRFNDKAPAPIGEVAAPVPQTENKRSETRPPREESDELPVNAADGESADDVTTLTDETSAKAMMMALMMQLERPMREWAAGRGLPLTDANGNYVLDQPYQQYDEDTLAALANNGDMWAQQILADRIAQARPAEAMELYRNAAAQGSIYAMIQIAELTARIAEMSPDFDFEEEFDGADKFALDQYYSLRDTPVQPKVTSFAWKAVAEMAGLPGFASLTGAQLPEADRVAACELAGSIYTDLLARRTSLGIGAYPGDAPPAWFDGEIMGKGSGCEHPEAVRYDFSDCRQIRYSPPGEEEDRGVFYVCDDS